MTDSSDYLPVGTTVRVIACRDKREHIGATGELIEVDRFDRELPYRVRITPASAWWFRKGDIEIMSNSVSDFTVGNKVMVLHRNPEDHRFVSKGATGEIIGIDPQDLDYPIRVKFAAGSDILKPDQLDKTTSNSLSGFSVGDKVTVTRRAVFDNDAVQVGAVGEVTAIRTRDTYEYPITVKFGTEIDDLKVDQLVKRQTHRDIRVGDRVEITDARRYVTAREGDRGTVTSMGMGEKVRYVRLDRTSMELSFNAETQLRKVTSTDELAKGDRVQIVNESGARGIGATVRHGDKGKVTSVDYGECSVKMEGSGNTWSLMRSHVEKIPHERLKVGDRIKVTNAFKPSVSIGDLGTVEYVGIYDDNMDVVIDGRDRSTILRQRDVEKLDVEPLKVGDSVEITNLRGRTLYSDKGTGSVRVGDRGTITRRSVVGDRWIVNLPERNYSGGGYAFAERDLRKVESDLSVGDTVRVDDLRSRHLSRAWYPTVNVGDVGTITRKTGAGTVFVRIDGKCAPGDEFSFLAGDLSKKTSSLTVSDLPTGTRVRIDDLRGKSIGPDRIGTRSARNGDHGTVINPSVSPRAGHVWVSIDDVTAPTNSYQFEPAQLSKLDGDKRIGDLKVGDRVKVTDGGTADRDYAATVSTGDTGVVTEIDPSRTATIPPVKVKFDADSRCGNAALWMSAEHMDKLAPLDKKRGDLKVGDRVRVTDAKNDYFATVTVGATGEIEEIKTSIHHTCPLRVKWDDTSLSGGAARWWMSAEHMEKLPEVDKHRGEFKKGDKVRVTDAVGPKRYFANGLTVGVTGVVESIDTGNNDHPLRVKWDDRSKVGGRNAYWMSAEHLAPLVRVWKRTDEPAGVTQVSPIDDMSVIYTRDDVSGKWARGSIHIKFTWSELLDRWTNGVQEVESNSDTDTDVDRAVRFFKENPTEVPTGHARGKHLRVLVERAIEQSDRAA